MNWIVAVLAVVAAIDVPQRARFLREAPGVQRSAVGGGLVGAAAVLAAAATPLLDALDVSSPTMEVGAGVVIALWSLPAMLLWSDEAAPDGLIPLLFPLVLTPAVGVAVIGVAARNGWWLPVVAAAAAAIPLALSAAGEPLARRPARAISGAIGAVAGVVMIVDGAFAV